MRPIALILLILVSATPVACSQQIPGSGHDEARQLLAAGDHAGAIAALKKADKGDVEAMVLLGAAHEKADKASDAWGSFDSAADALRSGKVPNDALLLAALNGRARTNGLRGTHSSGRAGAALQVSGFGFQISGFSYGRTHS